MERLKHQEAALAAAERAMQIGAARGEALEVEIGRWRKVLCLCYSEKFLNVFLEVVFVFWLGK